MGEGEPPGSTSPTLEAPGGPVPACPWKGRKLAVSRADVRSQGRSRDCFKGGRCPEDLPGLGDLVSMGPLTAQQAGPFPASLAGCGLSRGLGVGGRRGASQLSPQEFCVRPLPQMKTPGLRWADGLSEDTHLQGSRLGGQDHGSEDFQGHSGAAD